MDRQDGVPLLLAHVEDHTVAQDARHVHEDVDPAPRFDRLLDHLRRLLVVGNGPVVGGGGAAGLHDLVHDRGGRTRGHALAVEPRAEVVDDDLCPGLGQREGDAPADAAAGAGHHCGLSVEQSHGHSRGRCW